MKHLVNFSGGTCSFWAAHRTVARFGREDTVLLFADVLIEHPDLYEFNRRAEELLGIPITRISLGLTPWELFRQEGIIANDRFPICSTKLKREPLNEWMVAHYEMVDGQANFIQPAASVVLGFDWNEAHRVSAFQEQHPGWIVEAPMLEEPIWDKCRMLSEAEKLGMKTPTLYRLGFPHNNCGGGCVKAGISQFVHLYRVQRATFDTWAQQEWATKAEFESRGIVPMSVLKDRRGDGAKSKPLWLKWLAERIEAGEKFRTDEWGGCGCGGAA